jgi:hypothetical protein
MPLASSRDTRQAPCIPYVPLAGICGLHANADQAQWVQSCSLGLVNWPGCSCAPPGLWGGTGCPSQMKERMSFLFPRASLSGRPTPPSGCWAPNGL